MFSVLAFLAGCTWAALHGVFQLAPAPEVAAAAVCVNPVLWPNVCCPVTEWPDLTCSKMAQPAVVSYQPSALVSLLVAGWGLALRPVGADNSDRQVGGVVRAILRRLGQPATKRLTGAKGWQSVLQSFRPGKSSTS